MALKFFLIFVFLTNIVFAQFDIADSIHVPSPLSFSLENKPVCYTVEWINSYVKSQVGSLQLWNWALSIASIGLVLLMSGIDWIRRKQIKELKEKIKVFSEVKNEQQEPEKNHGCDCHPNEK